MGPSEPYIQGRMDDANLSLAVLLGFIATFEGGCLLEEASYTQIHAEERSLYGFCANTYIFFFSFLFLFFFCTDN